MNFEYLGIENIIKRGGKVKHERQFHCQPLIMFDLGFFFKVWKQSL